MATLINLIKNGRYLGIKKALSFKKGEKCLDFSFKWWEIGVKYTAPPYNSFILNFILKIFKLVSSMYKCVNHMSVRTEQKDSKPVNLFGGFVLIFFRRSCSSFSLSSADNLSMWSLEAKAILAQLVLCS